MTFNSNKVNLPRSVMIKLTDKFKIRCMMKKDPLLFHIMVKRNYLVHIGFKLSRNCIRQYKYFSRMACVLVPQCNFLNGFFQCQLLKDTIDVEVTVRTMKGIHMFKRDCTTQVTSCRRLEFPTLHFFHSLAKKMKSYLEERRNNANPFHPTCTNSDRPTTPPPKKSQVPKKRKARDTKKRSKSHQAGRRQYKVRRIEVPPLPP